MSAKVIRFPIVPNDTQRSHPNEVMADAISRMKALLAVYLEPGSRPSAEYILMAINGILEEPEVCEAAGIKRTVIIDHRDY